MIKSIEIHNFKKFERVTLSLSHFTVLMGENASGKTSLLQALAISLRMLATTGLVSYDKSKQKVAIRKKGVPYTQLPGLHVEDPRDVFYGKRTRGGGEGGVNPILFELTDRSDNRYKLQITTLFGAYNAKCVSTEQDFPAEPLLLAAPPLFVSGFVGIPASEERLFPIAIQDRLTRGRASEVLRNLLFELYTVDRARFDRLRALTKRNFDFELGRVAFAQDKDLYVHTSYQEGLGKRNLDLDLSTAGRGFLQVLQILTPIYLFADSCKVVLLDEPDAHLHPNLQRTVARVLREVAEAEKLQVIISTHSTAIIREVAPESVVPVSSDKRVLKGLGADDDLEGEIALRLDNFTSAKASIAGKLLFIEDQDRSIFDYIDAIAGVGLFDGKASIPVMSAQGKDDRVPFRIKDALRDVTGTDVEVFFIRDGDGLPPKWRQRLREYAESAHVTLLLLDFHEIESYLLVPTWSLVFWKKKAWPSMNR